ncbi:MAG: biopolymer transporter ExbD [Akkermansiaceae bacterium]|nr:biopolymer transporter ExbD [Akkermansia sp.]MCD7797931.1 biopolymer transporter ExbD [Akkermansiaceae bacterium]MCD8071204.1 biopolymer transporter ExbD [Akkermansiaceae bacterium]
MGKKYKGGDDGVKGAIDMSPMIDCVFLLIIFFVVNATAITVKKDPNVGMPTALSSNEMKDANGCIVINVFPDPDKMDPRVRTKFEKTYTKPNTYWSTDAATGFTVDEQQALTEFISKQKEAFSGKYKEEQIRLYIRGDKNAPFERTSIAIKCGAAAGVSNVVFGVLPTK